MLDLPPGGFLTRTLDFTGWSSHWSPPNENEESCIFRPPDLVGGLWWKAPFCDAVGDNLESAKANSTSFVKSITGPVYSSLSILTGFNLKIIFIK